MFLTKGFSSLTLVCVAIFVMGDDASGSHSNRQNVLFLMVDDLRPELGSYQNYEDSPRWLNPLIRTPHMDSLASKSLVLRNAYVQQALCSPSRVSVLTGRRPDTNRVVDLLTDFREAGGNFTTIPQYFKQNDYRSIGAGKVFHQGIALKENDPLSWSEPFFVPSTLPIWDVYTSSWRAVTPEEREEHPLPDDQVAEEAIRNLQRFAPGGEHEGENFFLAVGFYKPHLPFTFPEEYLDLYPLENISMPKHPFAPAYMPDIAWDPYLELRMYFDIPVLGTGGINTTLPDDMVLDLRRAYYASVSYVDNLIGQILHELHHLGLADNTIVALMGDHGFELGELGTWCKHDNFEMSTLTPLMIHVPGKTDSGLASSKLVEFVDVFPTLVEIADLPQVQQCPNDSSEVDVCSEGTSLVPLMTEDSDGIPWKDRVFMQYTRTQILPRVDIMGYSMRTDTYRYTEWPSFDYTTFLPDWTVLHGAELYDHGKDPQETVNDAEDPTYQELREELSHKLHLGWRAAVPPDTQPATTSQPSSTISTATKGCQVSFINELCFTMVVLFFVECCFT